MTPSIDEQISRIAKSKLRSASGIEYLEFKRGLSPRYFIVWRDIFFGYLALAVLVAALVQIQRLSFWGGVAAIPVVAALLGFTLAYLNLFFHEAAHWNLAPQKRWSDFFANWFIGIFFGQSVGAYRAVHFGHHQYHGTALDTEHSYFDPLNVRFIVGGLTGVRALQVARKRESIASKVTHAAQNDSRKALLFGLLLNGFIVGGLFLAGYWTVSIAWTLGILSVFPFFNAVRQLLEHRDEFAADDTDYGEVAHGRVNRLFGDSLLAQTLGGAGFNRHLLHHWEPQISYTRLKDLEKFVLGCDCADLFRQRQTTYTGMFLHFIRRRR